MIEAANAVRLLEAPLDRFDTGAGVALFLLQAGALLGVAAGAAWLTHSRRRALRRAISLMRELADRPVETGLEQSLRTATGDPTLALSYWRRDTGQYVDADGSIAGERSRSQAVARVVRGHEPVAVIRHDGHRLGHRWLEQELGAVARLAIDTERLRAETLAHLDRAARVAGAHRRRGGRPPAAGRARPARRRSAAPARRDLRAPARRAGADDDLAALLDEATACARACLDELREFAHGVFPAVLDEAGLEEALWSLADRSDVPVVIHSALGSGPRCPTAERTAYLVARAAVRDAPGQVGIDARRHDGCLVVVVTGVGTIDEVHLSDRVGAVRGELRHDGDRLEAVIPCG